MGEKEERQSEVREREESGREGEGMKWEVGKKKIKRGGRGREGGTKGEDSELTSTTSLAAAVYGLSDVL